MKKLSTPLASCGLALGALMGTNSYAAADESVSSYLDFYYAYNFNRPAPKPTQSSVTTDGSYTKYRGFTSGGTALRNFDVQDNQFSLALAEIAYRRTIEDVTIKIDLDAGDNAEMTHSSAAGVDEVSKHIGQAVVSYTPSSAKSFTLNVGKMTTHMGYEVTKAKDNWQYSRSLLYAFALPYWHNGINLNWAAIPDRLAMGFYIYNGWNNTYDSNRGKTLGLQIAMTPVSGLTVVYNGIGGPEQDENEKNKKIVHDLIVTYSLSDSVAFAGDFALGSEEKAIVDADSGEKSDAKWSALQLGFKFNVSPSFYISPRFESYWDRDGYTTGHSQTLHEGTLTASWKASGALEFRGEVRGDNSTSESYVKDREAVKSQTTISVSTLVTL